MNAQITILGKSVTVDLREGIDISIPVSKNGVKAWFVDDPKIEPVRMGDYVGSIEEGSAVNFMNVTFNPHGNGTHTECLSHISKNSLTINNLLKEAFLLCAVITIEPDNITHNDSFVKKGDRVIMPRQIESGFDINTGANAIAIRTLPNAESKKEQQYSGTNPAYFHPEAVAFLVNNGIDHLLTDLPSLDREEDGGKVKSHHTFWGIPENPHIHRTITELIYIPDYVKDGLYLLNLQLGAIAMDAAPSRPMLYPIK